MIIVPILKEKAIISGIRGITTFEESGTWEQAVGRQGNPLVALLNDIHLHHPTKWHICHGIKGIANIR